MNVLDLRSELEKYFGYSDFRPHQRAIVEQAMAGHDTLGVLPTGAGKSLCYQLPSLLLPRPTLVISPLIALMKDQLDSLPPAVYPQATVINSALDSDELNERMTGIFEGRYKLIYAAPERLRQESFLRVIERTGLSMLVVDEAHCVSVWGHDFRPDYLFIRKALDRLSETGDGPVVMAVTATATPEMQSEIAEQLGRDLKPLVSSVYRHNLRLEVEPCSNADDKMRRLAEICKSTPGSAVIYANSRDRCEQLAQFLQRNGVRAAHYHAGMEREARQTTQENFMLGKTRAIVATVAFGMGVDKSNVRLVAHFSLPESLEAYSQEAGRAGRDGEPSRCVLLYAPSDRTNLSRWLKQGEMKVETVKATYRALQHYLGKESGRISQEELFSQAFPGQQATFDGATKIQVAISLMERSGMVERQPNSGRDMFVQMLKAPPEARQTLDALLESRKRHAEQSLNAMLAYIEGDGCRHVAIARHFSQELAPCGDACDICLGTAIKPNAKATKIAPPTISEVPDFGQAILQGIAALPYPFGVTGLAKLLIGAADAGLSKEAYPYYGLLSGMARNAVSRYVETLVGIKLLYREAEDEYRRLLLTEEGREALEEGRSLIPNTNAGSAVARTSRNAYLNNERDVLPTTSSEAESDRFEKLRAWRTLRARKEKLPPYVIFHDSVLRGIAALNPDSLSMLSHVSGMGERKLESYGEEIIELLHGENAG